MVNFREKLNVLQEERNGVIGDVTNRNNQLVELSNQTVQKQELFSAIRGSSTQQLVNSIAENRSKNPAISDAVRARYTASKTRINQQVQAVVAAAGGVN